MPKIQLTHDHPYLDKLIARYGLKRAAEKLGVAAVTLEQRNRRNGVRPAYELAAKDLLKVEPPQPSTTTIYSIRITSLGEEAIEDLVKTWGGDFVKWKV